MQTLDKQMYDELTFEQFDYMKKQADLMEAYQIAGVDNWIGHDEAQKIYREEFEVED